MRRYDDNLILGYVEGDLSPDERARFEAQLARDPALRELVTDLARDRDALRHLPREEPPPHVIEDVMQRLERSMLLGDPAQPLVVEPAEHRRFRIGRVLSYSGLAAVILISGGVLLHTLTDVDLLDETARYASVGEWVETEENRPALAPTPTPAPGTPGTPQSPGSPGDRLGQAAAKPTAPDPETLASAEAEPEAPAPDAPDDATAATRVGALADADAEAATTAEPALGDTAMALAPPTDPTRGGESGAMQSMEVDEPEAEAETLADAAFSLRPHGLLDRMREEAAARVALAESRAPMQVKVVAREPQAARQDVLDWASRHQVAVTTVAVASPAGREAAEVRALAAADGQGPATMQLVVQVEPDQVPELLSYLNRSADQRAGLVQSPQVVVRRSEPQPRQQEPFDYYGGYRHAGEETGAAPQAAAQVAESMRTPGPAEPAADADAEQQDVELGAATRRTRVAGQPVPFPAVGLQPTPQPREKVRGDASPPAAAMQPVQVDEFADGDDDVQAPPPLLAPWWLPPNPIESMWRSAGDAGLAGESPSQATIALSIVITESDDPAP